MARVLMASLIALLLILTAAAAFAGVRGTYKGYPVVRVVLNGREITSDVPAVSLDGRTVLPVRALADALGLGVTWDEATYTVNLSGGSPSGSASIDRAFLRLRTVAELADVAATNRDSLKAYGGVIIEAVDGSVTLIDGSTLEAFFAGSITTEQLANRARYYFQQGIPAPVQTQPSNTTPLPSTSKIMVFGQDSRNTYLGVLSSNTLSPDSICNSVGIYGSSVSPTSIWNEVGLFGSSVGVNSAFNDLSQKPPKLVQDGNIVGYLTTNSLIQGGISPHGLCKRLEEAGL